MAIFEFNDNAGNVWGINDFGNLIDAERSFSETIDSTNFQIFLGGSNTFISYASPVVNGNTQAVNGTIRSGTTNLSISRSSMIGEGFVRMVEAVTNNSSTEQLVTIRLTDDIFYDSSTSIVSTSSGDTTVTAADDWTVYGRTATPTRPKLVHVYTSSTSSVASAANSSSALGIYTIDYTVRLAPGETRSIMHFYALAADDSSAIAFANSLVTLEKDAYLAGLTEQTLQNLDNFRLDVSSASSATLADYQRNLVLTGANAINGTGNAKANVITGNSANNRLEGLDGNDTLDGGVGADTLVGGQGNDTYILDSTSDVVIELANQGIDTIRTSFSINLTDTDKSNIERVVLLGSSALSAVGNAEANVLDGSENTAANRLTGNNGDDVYILGEGDTAVELAGGGVDTVQSRISVTLGANLENLTLLGSDNVNGIGNNLNNRIVGNSGNNSLSGAGGNDTLDGGQGADTLVGGAGDDSYLVDSLSDVVIESASGGTDTVTSSISYQLSNSVENLVLSGGAVKGTGNSGNNLIRGSSADNILIGGAGADTLEGGAGNDLYDVDNLGDVVVETFGQGIDTLRTNLSGMTLGANIENGILTSTAANLTGNELNNTLTGNSVANLLEGGLGNDRVFGGGGNDTLRGGDGDDLLVGDNGGPDRNIESGTTVVDGQSFTLNLTAPDSATGNVQVRGTIGTVNFSDTGVNVVYIIDRSGSTFDPFSGNSDVGDRNNDGSFNTILDASIASLDNLNRSIISSGFASAVRTTLIQFDDSAQILVRGGAADGLSSDGQTDISRALAGIRGGGGTAYNQALTLALNELSNSGSAKNLVFFLSDGAPTDGSTYITTAQQIRALGQGGTVIKAVGLGRSASEDPLDLLDDGINNDSALIVQTPEDLNATLLNSAIGQGTVDGSWIEIYKNGVLIDIVESNRFTVSPLGVQFESISFPLSASGTDRITATLISPDANGSMTSVNLPIRVSQFISNDTIEGGAGNDTLDGGVGADSLTGGLGNDTYMVDDVNDVVVELAGEGTDTVVSSMISYTLTSNLENLVLAATGVNGTGNSFANRLTGNDLNNSLDGGDGADTLLGGGGDDTLIGGAGNDSMEGGAGNDTYFVDSTFDSVTERSDPFNGPISSDTVNVTFSASLGGFASGVSTSRSFFNIENLQLMSSVSAVNALGSLSNNLLVGNENNNNLYGFEGNDTLDGGLGADTMDGGAGDDVYIVDNALDITNDSSGIDTVIANLNAYTLAASIENLVLANSSSVLAGTGNNGNNLITGNQFNNNLNGGAGADRMQGGLGDDTYTVDSTGDRIIEMAGEGTDKVVSSIGYALGTDLENLTLTGTNNISAAGNSLSNVIAGNAGSNRILGFSGNDTISGGGGDDTLIGGTGADVLDGNAGNDTYQYQQLNESTVSRANATNKRMAGIDQLSVTTGDKLDFTTLEVASLANISVSIADTAGSTTAAMLLSTIAASVTEGAGRSFLVNVIDNDAEPGSDGSFSGTYLVITGDSVLSNNDSIIELVGMNLTASVNNGDILIG